MGRIKNQRTISSVTQTISTTKATIRQKLRCQTAAP